MQLKTNIERAADIIAPVTTPPGTSIARGVDRAILAAQVLADAGLLMPDLPRPTRDMLHAHWDVGTTIIRTGYGGAVIVEWQPGPDNAVAIFTPDQVKAISAAHLHRDRWREREERMGKELNDHHAEQEQDNV